MALSPGIRLGRYEILSPLGAGGMGEVYRARDTKLDRDVAIKILPDVFAADPERLARFEREAKTLASLDHPNIAHIYGIEGLALVMEFVDGNDLSQRLARGPIAVDEALSIARQIAEALEAAHERGIIHRDLKPANIMVTTEGIVKVLDFGLAKASRPAVVARPAGDVSQSPTMTIGATQAGVVLGTAAYMAPEQAKGHVVDKRSDIWAFGCVFYEMLAGRRAFGGDDPTEIIAAVIRADPDWSRLPTDIPAAVRVLLERCLEKDRTRRASDIAVAKFLLEPRTLLHGAPVQAVSAERPLAFGGRSLAIVSLSAAAGALIAAAAGGLSPPPSVSLPVTRIAVSTSAANTFGRTGA